MKRELKATETTPNRPKSTSGDPKTASHRDRHGRLVPDDPKQDLPMRRFIRNVDTGAFAEALLATGDAKYSDFLRARLDPAYRKVSFTALCRRFNITLQEVDDLWRSHQLHSGMIRMMNRVPDILEDVAEDARAKMTVCPRCDGLKRVSGRPKRPGGAPGPDRDCPVCSGAGKIRVAGDKTSRELVFETLGLTGKHGAGPLVALNFGLDTGLEELLRNARSVINNKDAIPVDSGSGDEE